MSSLLASISELPVELLAERYSTAQPYPHLIIDDFLPEAEALALEQACRQAPTPTDSSNGFCQVGKTTLNDWSRMPSTLFDACALFSCGPVLEWLEAITSIHSLVADPHLDGGGLHRTERGGFLKLHTDFNWNKRLGLYRRLNVLLYLNSQYQAAWGGDLLLTKDPGAQSLEAMVSIQPVFNRLVVFGTNDTTYHGQPVPHHFPINYPRTSLAFYYYSSLSGPWWERRRLRSTTTRFRPAMAERFPLSSVPFRRRLAFWLRRWTPLG